MLFKSFIVISLLILSSVTGFSQVREIPKAVMETFSNQYPKAENADFKDQLVKVYVNFEMDGEKYMATYNNKGIWKGTEKEWDFDKLSDDVKEGFNKSKYADRDVEETAVLYLPGGGEQYRLKVKKSDVEKKYLFFNTEGRLLRESLTL